MASNVLPLPVPAQQPGLLSFVVFDHLPEGCVAFEVASERAAPHLHRGDFAIVDTADRAPMHGEMFLIEWKNGSQEIVEVTKFVRPERIVNWDGSTHWEAGWQQAVVTLAGKTAAVSRWKDGPYRTEHMAAKLKGRVVGIYQPDFLAQLRLAA